MKKESLGIIQAITGTMTDAISDKITWQEMCSVRGILLEGLSKESATTQAEVKVTLQSFIDYLSQFSKVCTK